MQKKTIVGKITAAKDPKGKVSSLTIAPEDGKQSYTVAASETVVKGLTGGPDSQSVYRITAGDIERFGKYDGQTVRMGVTIYNGKVISVNSCAPLANTPRNKL